MDKVFLGLLLAIFGGIVLHAPLSVGLGTLFPDYSLLIKSWKEILLGIALVLAVILVTRRRVWRQFNTPLFWLIGAFAALNLLLIPFFDTGTSSIVSGLFINLRFLLFFVLVFVALQLYPQVKGLFLKVFAVGAVVVVGFATLQLTVLPHDALKHIGYNETTIVPYMTVDNNIDYIRIGSTLRGPNPLGAYIVIVLAVLLAFLFKSRRKFTKQQLWAMGLLGAGGLVTMWATYSRSAALALVLSMAIVALLVYGRRIAKGVWLGVIIALLVLGGSVLALRETQFVSQVILHEDPHEGNDINSNDGHVESLIDGTQRMLAQPFGAGIGSTGSASLLGEKPLIIENQYLFTAHEVGWLGLALFLVIFYLLMLQ